MKKQIILASILIILAMVVSLTGGVLATNEANLLPGENLAQNTTENVNNIITENIIQNNINGINTLQNNTNGIENTTQNNINNVQNVNTNQQSTITNTQISGTIDDDRLQGINEELYNLASTPKRDNRKTIVAAIIAITAVIIAGLIVLWYRTNGY